jgi:hypothetical protein
MLGNFLFTLLYLAVAVFLAFAAWTNYYDLPPLLLWIGAGIFLIIGLWRLLHLSKG